MRGDGSNEYAEMMRVRRQAMEQLIHAVESLLAFPACDATLADRACCHDTAAVRDQARVAIKTARDVLRGG